jgi:CHAT domain-containing protein
VSHFAPHAIIDDTDPLGSFLALEGGNLTVADIYTLRLDADLVLLSACRTALGPISGDGVAGVTRAFVYAGAASVMATTWDVADAPTVRLVQQFYRRRLRGAGKAAALREAQLQLLTDLRGGRVIVQEPDGPVALRPDPYFWAGFVLVGEP